MDARWSETKSWKIKEEDAQELLNAYLADKEPKDETLKTMFKIAKRLNTQLASSRQASLRSVSRHALSVYRSPHPSTKVRSESSKLLRTKL